MNNQEEEWREDLCWNCQKHPISTKDYRTDKYGMSGKTYSCEYCVILNDMNYYRVSEKGLDPKELLEE